MYYQLFSRISHLESFVLSLNQLFVLPINLGARTLGTLPGICTASKSSYQ